MGASPQTSNLQWSAYEEDCFHKYFLIHLSRYITFKSSNFQYDVYICVPLPKSGSAVNEPVIIVLLLALKKFTSSYGVGGTRSLHGRAKGGGSLKSVGNTALRQESKHTSLFT